MDAIPMFPELAKPAPVVRLAGNAPDLGDLLPAFKHARQWHSRWSSPEALCAHLEAHPNGWQTACRRDTDRSFRGTKSMAEAFALCRDGWQDGAAAARRIRDRITTENPRAPRVVRFDVAGARPDSARALAGNPLFMRRNDPTRTRRRPVVTLVSDMCVHAGIAADALVRRAGAVAAIVDKVEEAGFSCHVISYAATTDHGGLVASVAVTLKEPNDPADMARLAFGLGHPAMFRRLGFAAWSEDRFTENLEDSLGWVQPLDPTPAMADAGVYVMPSCNSARAALFNNADKTATTGLAYLLESLTQQGCPAFPA